jgi:hypothetical protein
MFCAKGNLKSMACATGRSGLSPFKDPESIRMMGRQEQLNTKSSNASLNDSNSYKKNTLSKSKSAKHSFGTCLMSFQNQLMACALNTLHS